MSTESESKSPFQQIAERCQEAKIEISYSSPYSQDITTSALQNLMKYKFEYNCHKGGLYYRDGYGNRFYFKKADGKEFVDLYSEFSIDI